MKKVILILALIVCYLTGFSQEFGNFTDPRDGKVYKTVKIGEQWIMAENLAYKPDNDGYWAFKDDSGNVAKYGYLYNWETAKSIAPSGWHLPSKEDWMILHENLGRNDNKVFDAMKEGGSSGFNFLLPGWRAVNGNFYPEGERAYFWSCDAQDREHAYIMYCVSSNQEAKLGNGVNSFGFSVRLFADKEEDMVDRSLKTANPQSSAMTDSITRNKAKTLTSVYAKTYFEVRFMNVAATVSVVLIPTFGAVAYQNDIKGNINFQNTVNQTIDDIAIETQRKNSNEFEKKMGDFSVLSYFANSFYNTKDSIKKYNIILTLDKSEHSKIINRLNTGNKKNLDTAFTNELNNSNTQYVSAFKFQYGIGARAGNEQFGLTKTYRPFVRLTGYIKDVNSNFIVWRNAIIIFSTKELHGRDEAQYINEEELKKEFKKISNKLITTVINDLNGTRYSSTEQLVDISSIDDYLK
jgi:uncharacterized protein (TIGR02145 family)